ncbi:MAG TPA: hypothetical protein VHG28_22000 [Longimicrobiaceae bacterium]|nr:hypothetical protein [Longimicrobiaceae bacterium]
MNTIIRTTRRAFPLLALAALPEAVGAQLISLKTVPVATGDQFLVFPSQNLGMGSVSIALEDPLLDPFVNPARGGRISGSPAFGSPTVYTISDENGSGRTLPAGALFGSGEWFGGALLAFQQIVEGNPLERSVPDIGFTPSQRLSDRSSYNRYGFAMLGRKLGGASLAASVFGADLSVVDGVEILYPRAESLHQDGSMLDYRLGVAGGSPEGRSYEALLLHNRFRMQHDVGYVDWIWDPVARVSTRRHRTEVNRDRTNTWGVHLGTSQPLGATGWRIGGIVTGNWKEHPKIPNYELVNIPRDPGNSWAYNFGVGLSRTEGPATLGIDLVYEPAWSDTWAEADTAVRTASGQVIPPGGKTIENDFRFSNVMLRTGIGREGERWSFQAGLQVRGVHYWLEQHDNLRGTRREQEEDWMEWSPTWGLGVKFPEFQVRYVGKLTTGTGRPGVEWAGPTAADAFRASDIVVAPGGALTLQESNVFTHQVSVSVPLGRSRGW